ncbi:cytochrome b-c1 complex subunit 9-like [Carcharodon carcharias]|uniref:cytochrome b-c1 complex subunit 9-like n=1 Tax=Carcharodon carcharias TaxID=13397 RepID=UPI001B7E8853|nr:cytochrome b-c1 complex subunit 9-like [Carcharodon carcharias]
MAMLRQVYNLMFKRTSTFALSIVLGTIFFEMVFDQAGDAVFEHINWGKLWKCIKHNYENNEEE